MSSGIWKNYSLEGGKFIWKQIQSPNQHLSDRYLGITERDELGYNVSFFIFYAFVLIFGFVLNAIGLAKLCNKRRVPQSRDFFFIAITTTNVLLLMNGFCELATITFWKIEMHNLDYRIMTCKVYTFVRVASFCVYNYNVAALSLFHFREINNSSDSKISTGSQTASVVIIVLFSVVINSGCIFGEDVTSIPFQEICVVDYAAEKVLSASLLFLFGYTVPLMIVAVTNTISLYLLRFWTSRRTRLAFLRNNLVVISVSITLIIWWLPHQIYYWLFFTRSSLDITGQGSSGYMVTLLMVYTFPVVSELILLIVITDLSIYTPPGGKPTIIKEKSDLAELLENDGLSSRRSSDHSQVNRPAVARSTSLASNGAYVSRSLSDSSTTTTSTSFEMQPLGNHHSKDFNDGMRTERKAQHDLEKRPQKRKSRKRTKHLQERASNSINDNISMSRCVRFGKSDLAVTESCYGLLQANEQDNPSYPGSTNESSRFLNDCDETL